MEDRLNTILSNADQALKAGHAGDAVKQYEAAIEMVRKEPLLAEQEQRVLRKVGNGYVQANRPTDAIPIFQKLLESVKEDCASETTSVSTCASAQQDLAVSKMHAGDFEGGLASLRQAETNYSKAEKLSGSHEFAMIQLMDQANARVLIAVALFRLGKTADAVTTAEGAIPQLNRVKDDSDINVGIRESAASSANNAQTILAQLKSAH
ncbi:MAG: tetratricopeptide repeat protein [Acidobacteria bacterium]|nr:tetratricopeptide repeat protein [Acidobacteriota bacterium]